MVPPLSPHVPFTARIVHAASATVAVGGALLLRPTDGHACMDRQRPSDPFAGRLAGRHSSTNRVAQVMRDAYLMLCVPCMCHVCVILAACNVSCLSVSPLCACALRGECAMTHVADRHAHNSRPRRRSDRSGVCRACAPGGGGGGESRNALRVCDPCAHVCLGMPLSQPPSHQDHELPCARSGRLDAQAVLGGLCRQFHAVDQPYAAQQADDGIRDVELTRA